MANRYVKRCSIPLIIHEMQIKTTKRNHLTSVTMPIIKKSTNNKCWRRCREKETLLHYCWECKLIQPLQRTVWKFLKKLKTELPYDPYPTPLPYPITRHITRENYNSKDTCTPMYIAAIFTIARIQKQPKCPSTKE